MASTADITSDLQLGRPELLRGLRNFLNMNRPEHHSIDRLKERGVEKRSGRYSTLQGRERFIRIVFAGPQNCKYTPSELSVHSLRTVSIHH